MNGVAIEPKVLELQIGQVNSTKDTMFLLRKIVEKITVGITNMKPKEGRSQIEVLLDKKGEHRIKFYKCGENEKDFFQVQVEWFLIGTYFLHPNFWYSLSLTFLFFYRQVI